jgi:hypothetical protein
MSKYENGSIRKLQLFPSILKSYNIINIDYTINNINELYNIIMRLKTLFSMDFKLSNVKKVIDTKNNIISLNKKMINSPIIHKTDNIFHTYEDTSGFISYNKYKHESNDIISIDTGRIISVERNIKTEITESYNNDMIINYLEYQFNLEYNIEVLVKQYLYDVEHYRLRIHIPINEEKHILSEKEQYINDICDKIEVLINE